MSQSFSKPHERSSLAARSDLASLKAEVDKKDLDKLKIILVDLNKLSNVVDRNVVKNTIYDKLVTKVNALDSKKLI